MSILIGADWDKEKCVLAVLEEGKRVRHAKVQRTPHSVMAFLAAFAGQLVRVALESGDAFWATLWRQAGAEVLVFDGKKSHRFGQSLKSSGASDDRHSAADLLAMLQSQAHVAACNPTQSPQAKGLSCLLEWDNSLTEETTRRRNQLTADLRQFYPSFAAVVGPLSAAWVLRLLIAAPTATAWNKLSAKRQDKLLGGSSKEKRPSYKQALSDDWGAVAAEMEAAVRIRIRHTAKLLQNAEKAQAETRKELDAQAQVHPVAKVLRGINGIGPVLSAGISVALDQSDGTDRDAAAKKLGVAPVTRRSGTLGDKAPLVTMRRSSTELMRRLGHYIAVQLVRLQPWAKAAFSYYRAHGKSSFGSYRVISRSFLRVILALLRDGSEFDEKRYVAALKTHGVPWAMAL